MKGIFPYPTLFGDVNAVIDNVRVDGEPIAPMRIDPRRREIELAELERAGWRTASLVLEVKAPANEIETLRAEGSEPAAVVVAHCGPTNARKTTHLELASDEGTTWSGTLELDRGDWFGRISLHPVIVAKVGGVPGRIIGEAPDWSIALDDLPRPPVTGALTVKWEDFDLPSEESLIFLRDYVGDPLFLHLDPEAPVLYLNRSFEGLFALLQDRRRRPAGEQALHDQTRGSIAMEVWLSLFNASLQSLERNDGEADWPASEWQKAVLELIFDRMYPEKSSEDALHEVVVVLSEPEGGTTVQQLALPAIAAQAGATRLLRQAISRIGADTSEERTG